MGPHDSTPSCCRSRVTVTQHSVPVSVQSRSPPWAQCPAAAMLSATLTWQAPVCGLLSLARIAACQMLTRNPTSIQRGAACGASAGQLGGSVRKNCGIGYVMMRQQRSIMASSLLADGQVPSRGSWSCGRGSDHWRSYGVASSWGKICSREASIPWISVKVPSGWRDFAAASWGSSGPSPTKLRAVPFTVTRSEAVAEYEAYHSAHWMYKRPSDGATYSTQILQGLDVYKT